MTVNYYLFHLFDTTLVNERVSVTNPRRSELEIQAPTCIVKQSKFKCNCYSTKNIETAYVTLSSWTHHHRSPYTGTITIHAFSLTSSQSYSIQFSATFNTQIQSHQYLKSIYTVR